MTDHTHPTKIHELSLKGVEPAPDPGPRPEFVWLPVDWLHVNSVYQRAMNSARSRRLVRKIVEEFTWTRFQPITVTEIGAVEGFASGAFAVIDGQHRAAAAILHPAVTEVPCWVVDAPEIRQQAKAFVGINADRNGMTSIQIFKSKLAAGDHDATQVRKVCDQAGITIAFQLSTANKILPPRHTMAVSTIQKLVGKYGEKPVVTALQALATAYDTVENQLRGQVISAVTRLVAKHFSRIEIDRLVEVLRTRDAEDLTDAARQVKRLEGGTTEAGMVRALLADYDKGLTPAKRLRPVARAA